MLNLYVHSNSKISKYVRSCLKKSRSIIMLCMHKTCFLHQGEYPKDQNMFSMHHWKGRHSVPVSPRVGGCGKNKVNQQKIDYTTKTSVFFVHPTRSHPEIFCWLLLYSSLCAWAHVQRRMFVDCASHRRNIQVKGHDCCAHDNLMLVYEMLFHDNMLYAHKCKRVHDMW